ncbi:inositol polyphosphate-4-phosphatase type I A isoform X1 [Aplysia californica]|uniref:Inositol polyphosphate-4-phosphatase type I A isoform X1 n=1 Tax=Aplysia californica TaxID=6500 RepID=A0ABM0JY61_APLCA|nr:inositol polyphosphate-4-phosphatase type I A isoform X1 [Aplysia californica]
MRFNSKEISVLLQNTHSYDREGYLQMKDKQEGLFKKSEAYISRYIRLKGNLLFYFKNKEIKSEPIGVIILERCVVELDLQEEVDNGFLLVFEGEDQPIRFGASSETLRDNWIQALHVASHECLKMQLQSLREQVQARTGRDPVVLPAEPNSTVDFESHSDNASEDPVLEISLACSNLSNDSTDVAPNVLVVVHTILPPQQQIWLHHNHTEIVEKSTSPQFLKTIGFGDKYGIDTSTRVRLTVHHVVERMTGTMTQLGQAIFTLQDVLRTNDLLLSLVLRTPDQKEAGEIVITAWINDDRVSLSELQTQQVYLKSTNEEKKSGSYSKRPRTLSLGRHSHNLQAHFNDIIKRSFRFATNNQKSLLQVSEYMGESKWTFEMPIQLLRLLVQEEKQMISILQDFGELVSDWEAEQILWIRMGADAAEFFTNSLDLLTELSGMTFKRSADKSKPELEFVPINLHMERMVVSSDTHPAGKFYDMTTVGSFAAHARDMKSGGLKRLLHQLRASYKPDDSPQPRTKVQRACSILNQATELRVQLKQLCERLGEIAAADDFKAMGNVVENMKELVNKLNSLCADPLVTSAAEAYLSAKRNANTSEGADSASLTNMSEVGGQGSDVEKAWKWSGSSFVKSPTMEPWGQVHSQSDSSRSPETSTSAANVKEVTRLNLEAAFVCLVSVVEEMSRRLSQAHTDQLLGTDPAAGSLREELAPPISKLQGFLEIVWARLSLFLTFVAVMENKGQVKTASDIKIRRDIVNSHAITTLVSSFVALTQTEEFSSPEFAHQLSSVGLLCQAEGLLSCYGSELCMLEDTITAMDDLRHVTLRLVPAVEDDFTPNASLGTFIKEGPYPDISRHNIIIDIPVPRETFSRLPTVLQQGKQIPVTPVLFNIGINEQATLAEKFGSTALQEKLNIDSYATLYEYYSQFSQHFEDPLDKTKGVASLSHMMKLLQNHVMTKKSKNVDVLHMAEEVTRALRGLRVTFCKSGKDRTAMAVTLEMVHILQRHHNLASHVFMQSLDCLRSVGCRRENTLKNTGVKKYAFISLQMLYIPKMYRAPSGTYGNVQT